MKMSFSKPKTKTKTEHKIRVQIYSLNQYVPGSAKNNIHKNKMQQFFVVAKLFA